MEVKSLQKGSKVRALRESLGLGRTVFGAKIGYSYLQMQRIEDGTVGVSDEICRKICEEYGVSEKWLMGEDDKGGFPFDESVTQRRQRVRQAYMESGLTQREFAEKTHTTTSMLGDAISGRRQLTIHYAKKIEETLGIGADWLLYGDADAKDYPLSDAMIKYLKKHPEARKRIQEWMIADETVAGGSD